MITLTHAKRLRPGAAILTQQMKAVVPSVEGLEITDIDLTVTGAVEADRTALQAVLDAYDPQAVEDAQRQREQRIAAERAKRSTTLTLLQRVERLEIILGLD